MPPHKSACTCRKCLFEYYTPELRAALWRGEQIGPVPKERTKRGTKPEKNKVWETRRRKEREAVSEAIKASAAERKASAAERKAKRQVK